MAAFALTNKSAAGFTREIAERPIKLRRHSGRRWFGFPQGSDLNEY